MLQRLRSARFQTHFYSGMVRVPIHCRPFQIQRQHTGRGRAQSVRFRAQSAARVLHRLFNDRMRVLGLTVGKHRACDYACCHGPAGVQGEEGKQQPAFGGKEGRQGRPAYSRLEGSEQHQFKSGSVLFHYGSSFASIRQSSSCPISRLHPVQYFLALSFT